MAGMAVGKKEEWGEKNHKRHNIQFRYTNNPYQGHKHKSQDERLTVASLNSNQGTQVMNTQRAITVIWLGVT